MLLPDVMDGRRVLAGHLGCPACGWNTAWDASVPDFGEGRSSHGPSPGDADSVAAFLGLSGPGGWLALVGAAGAIAAPLGALLPGISMVAINPPEGLASGDQLSLLRSAAWPLKAQSMRGVIVGADEAAWNASAVRSVLPGLRCVGTGAPPLGVPGTELMAEAEGVWVVRRR